MDLTNLWQKYKSGTATPEDLAVLNEQLKSKKGIAEIENILQTEWQQTPLNAVTDFSPQDTLQKLKQKIALVKQAPPARSAASRTLRVVKTLRRVAAAVLLLSIAGTIAWWQINKKQQQPIVEMNATNSVQQISLSDGTKVWLNQNSRLLYQQDFNKVNRVLTLEGEAFFEVAEDPQRPFIVYAGGFGTRALGTSFNIRAFKDSSDVKIALFTGKVAVSALRDGQWQKAPQRTLVPGKQLRYEVKAQRVVIEDFNPESTLAWREGKWVFENESLTSVLQRLEKYYAVDIQFNAPQLSRCLIRTSFDKKETLNNILTILKFSEHLEFTQRGSTYTVTAGSACE